MECGEVVQADDSREYNHSVALAEGRITTGADSDALNNTATMVDFTLTGFL